MLIAHSQVASVSGEVAVAGAGAHLVGEHLSDVLVAEAFNLLLGAVIGVMNLGGTVHLAGSHSLKLEPVDNGAEGGSEEKSARGNVFGAATGVAGATEASDEGHSEGVVEEHRSQVSLIVVAEEVKHQVVAEERTSTGESVGRSRVLEKSNQKL